MRNWNSFLDEFWEILLNSCEPTYEELKLSSGEREKTPSLSCEPTYEELKPAPAWISRSVIPRCEPTYEELKQFAMDPEEAFKAQLRAYLWGIETFFGCQMLLLLLLVASLPMRNWNSKAWYSFLLIINTLRAYLWGIETKVKAIMSLTDCKSCEPTYEELKQKKWERTDYRRSRYEPTYEECY